LQRGRFITFEGGEGAGKTTQISLFETALKAQGTLCVRTREPGGCAEAEALRQLVLVKGYEWLPESETMLFLTARLEHWHKIIQPALLRGKTVLCDRFADSTLVYQGMGKALGAEWIYRLSNQLLGEIQPDITFFLDIAVEDGLARARNRGGSEQRFEEMENSFHHHVREGFLQLAKHQPERVLRINASGSPEEVHGRIMAVYHRVTDNIAA
jgi:dTMP kinase